MQGVLIVSVPLITILAGLFFNRSEIQSLRTEMRSEIKDPRSEMNSGFDRIYAELRYFHGVTRQAGRPYRSSGKALA